MFQIKFLHEKYGMRVIWNSALRITLGCKREVGAAHWRTFNNEGIRNLYSSSVVIMIFLKETDTGEICCTHYTKV
jgi:hypothetical protein